MAAFYSHSFLNVSHENPLYVGGSMPKVLSSLFNVLGLEVGILL